MKISVLPYKGFVYAGYAVKDVTLDGYSVMSAALYAVDDEDGYVVKYKHGHGASHSLMDATQCQW